ncbi:sigma-70 family RNA polymerase sigma factor [Kribbella antibiotica]|uniref:Sigma-70 family RNA polymerase sigma factor n=1 Tax=Kribbella antibiotica TaxID=190195 RepID=A0A4R4ZNJ9_9ACTN|nr:sigma-70 family RNA polymerase sigma factor [Kribbella antibiotica]TDD60461.1 sigma-70 family RNA polymerase sigma factor [Kribbella antibiotica]
MTVTDTTDSVAEDHPPPEDRPLLAGPAVAEEFARLFDLHAVPMHRYLARRVGAEQAHDLVSETFLAAFRQRETYDPALAAAKAWLYGIATNLARRHVRSEVRGLHATARAGRREDDNLAAHDGRVAEQVDAQKLARRIAPAIADLSDGDRDVLLLTSWAGLTTVEVADALGIPVGTVRSRLHRVRRQLRTLTTSEEAHDHD